MTTRSNVQVVHPGACVVEDSLIEFVRDCVLEPSECTSASTKFWSSRQLLESLYIDDVCLDRVGEVQTGRCKSGTDERTCTNEASVCLTGEEFDNSKTESNDCMVENTPFGKCVGRTQNGQAALNYDVGVCVWSSSACDLTTHSWINEKGLCYCEDIQTGACRFTNEESNDSIYYCAVSADACDSETTFLTTQEMESTGIDCRLCNPPSNRESPDKTSPSFSKPTTLQDDKADAGEVAAKVFFSITGGLVAIFAVVFLRHWCCRAGREPPPMEGTNLEPTETGVLS